MRHRKNTCYLNRNASHRKAMFRNMADSLFRYEIIKTTLPKAKKLRCFVEKIINLSKIDNVKNRRLVFSYIRDRAIVAKLFMELGPRFFKRPGGYTRILKSGFRITDRASMAYIELMDRFQKKESVSTLD